MPPKPPPSMSIFLVAIVEKLSAPFRVLAEHFSAPDRLWRLEYTFDAASLPIVSRQGPYHGYTQYSHFACLGRSPGTHSQMDLREKAPTLRKQGRRLAQPSRCGSGYVLCGGHPSGTGVTG